MEKVPSSKTYPTGSEHHAEAVTHHKTVQLELDGRGWDTSYQKFYLDQTPNTGWNLGMIFEVNTEFDLAWRLPISVS